jgi:predicted nucleic acid-binding protein
MAALIVNDVYILDACSILAGMNGEPGGNVAKELIARAGRGEIHVFMNVVQALEVYYDRIYVKGKDYADQYLTDLYASPVEIIDVITADIVREAGRFKTSYHIALADSFAVATASVLGVPLVTADHEFDEVEQNERIAFVWIR